MIVFSGDKPIAEILPGESIGEIAFLMGGKRTATVKASRNSQLLQIEQSIYKTLIQDIPDLSHSIIQSLAGRLTVSNTNTPELEPKTSNVVALLSVDDSVLSDVLISQLLSLKNEINSNWKILNVNDLENIEQLTKWIQENERLTIQLVLVATDINKNTGIALAMAEHADKTFLIINGTQEKPAPISEFEINICKNSVLNNIDLVILRKESSIKISGTSKLLENRQIHLHHHVALDHQPDLERLQRFIAGEAVGLVLCGGGAFGTAHLGMIKALQENGYYFDMIGGTSIGSAISALYALGKTPDEALKQLEDMFLNKKVMKKYSLPLYSFIDQKYFDQEVKKGATNIDIEDLPINYFAIATNLSRNKLQLIKKGPLWQAIRSSCSLPGILPPFIKDGEVLIDGAIMDNTPINTIRAIKSGPNIVMNFTPSKTWKVNNSYDEIPRGLSLFKQVLTAKNKQKKYFPSIFAVLSRTMVSNTEKRFTEIDEKDDIFLETKRLQKMGMMNWQKSREQFDLAYSQMQSALKEIDLVSKQDKIETLRDVARLIKTKKPAEN